MSAPINEYAIRAFIDRCAPDYYVSVFDRRIEYPECTIELKTGQAAKESLQSAFAREKQAHFRQR